MKHTRSETIRLMKMLGHEVGPGSIEDRYDLALSPEEEVAFNCDLSAIAEAERLGALEGDTIILDE